MDKDLIEEIVNGSKFVDRSNTYVLVVYKKMITNKITHYKIDDFSRVESLLNLLCREVSRLRKELK